MEQIAFIGGGNMAASLIGGLIAAGHAPSAIHCLVRSAESVARLTGRFGIHATASLPDFLAHAGAEGFSTLVIAVKPQQLQDVLPGLRWHPQTTVVSVVAGVRIATLRRWIGEGVDIIRTMPNTPALIRRGVTGLYAESATGALARQRAETLMRAAGSTCWVDSEPAIDAVTALSGSGPAYFFAFVEALREAGQSLGLPTDVANQLALETFIGAAALTDNLHEDVAELRRQVTSKGGTTEAALQQLDLGGFKPLISAALRKATERAAERADAAEAESLAQLQAQS